MGFLLGAFGKLAAGSRYRSLQAQMMRVQSRLRRATRQAADMEKLINRQEKAALNSLTVQGNAAKQLFAASLQGQIFSGDIENIMKKSQSGEKLTSEESTAYSRAMSQYSSEFNTNTSVYEQSIALQKQSIQDYFEQLRDSQLQPLKDEEDNLQSEKDSLESQIQIAKMDYEACKEMEKSDAQMLKPSYTAQA